MKQSNNDFFKIGIKCLAGFGWVTGLLLAGSENATMPWINILGLALFAGSSLLMGKAALIANRSVTKSRHLTMKKQWFSCPVLKKHHSVACVKNVKLNHAVGVLLKS